MLHIVLSQILQSDPVHKYTANIRNIDNEFAKQLNFKGIRFPVHKKYFAKIKKYCNILLVYLVIQMKHLIAFILQNKLLESILIHYYSRILKTPIIDRFMTKKMNHHGEKHFFNIPYKASLAQKYQYATYKIVQESIAQN